MASRDGDGWVSCRCGARHWGLHGAAGLVLWRRAGAGTAGPQVLLQHRAGWVHDGGTWAVPGGARDSHEDPVGAALREAHEEVGVRAEDLAVGRTLTGTDHGDWRYDYVLAEAGPGAHVHAANEETEALGWVGLAEETGLPLHPGLARDWARLVAAVVDLTGRTGPEPASRGG